MRAVLQANGFSSPIRLLESQHEIEVLHRSPRSAFAEIVEQGHEPRLAVFFRPAHVELHAVGTVQILRRQRAERSGFVQRVDLDKRLAGIGFGQRGMQVAKPGFARQRMQRERHFQDHAMDIVADDRRKQRDMVEAGVRFHFRHMLVRA